MTEIEFIEFTPDNLCWFWKTYRNNFKTHLTTYGAELLYKLVSSKKYYYPLQPPRIRKHILKMLRTNYAGEKLADILEATQPASTTTEKLVLA